jgi:outer membrane PBP1 activator LpoA protein
MKAILAMVIVAVLCTACSTVLKQADAKMAAEDYSGALALYTEYLQTNPQSSQAERARATSVALKRLLASQVELDRVQREHANRQVDVNRLKGEVAKLRADLERLRNIDLHEGRAK